MALRRRAGDRRGSGEARAVPDQPGAARCGFVAGRRGRGAAHGGGLAHGPAVNAGRPPMLASSAPARRPRPRCGWGRLTAGSSRGCANSAGVRRRPPPPRQGSVSRSSPQGGRASRARPRARARARADARGCDHRPATRSFWWSSRGSSSWPGPSSQTIGGSASAAPRGPWPGRRSVRLAELRAGRASPRIEPRDSGPWQWIEVVLRPTRPARLPPPIAPDHGSARRRGSRRSARSAPADAVAVRRHRVRALVAVAHGRDRPSISWPGIGLRSVDAPAWGRCRPRPHHAARFAPGRWRFACRPRHGRGHRDDGPARADGAPRVNPCYLPPTPGPGAASCPPPRSRATRWPAAA